MEWVIVMVSPLTTKLASGQLSFPCNEHNEAWTKWLPFCRQHFQMDFLQWKCLYHDSHFNKICPRGLTDNESSMVQVNIRGPFYWHGLTLIPAGISNHIHYKVWDEITYPFLNFHGCTAEVWEWMSNCNPHSSGHVITYPCSDSGDQFTHALQDSSLALKQSSGYSSAFEFILCK